jgi:hypothetical protein
MGDSEDDMQNGGKRPSEAEGGSAPPTKKVGNGSSKGTRSRSGSNSGGPPEIFLSSEQIDVVVARLMPQMARTVESIFERGFERKLETDFRHLNSGLKECQKQLASLDTGVRRVEEQLREQGQQLAQARVASASSGASVCLTGIYCFLHKETSANTGGVSSAGYYFGGNAHDNPLVEKTSDATPLPADWIELAEMAKQNPDLPLITVSFVKAVYAAYGFTIQASRLENLASGEWPGNWLTLRLPVFKCYRNSAKAQAGSLSRSPEGTLLVAVVVPDALASFQDMYWPEGIKVLNEVLQQEHSKIFSLRESRPQGTKLELDLMLKRRDIDAWRTVLVSKRVQSLGGDSHPLLNETIYKISINDYVYLSSSTLEEGFLGNMGSSSQNLPGDDGSFLRPELSEGGSSIGDSDIGADRSAPVQPPQMGWPQQGYYVPPTYHPAYMNWLQTQQGGLGGAGYNPALYYPFGTGSKPDSGEGYYNYPPWPGYPSPSHGSGKQVQPPTNTAQKSIPTGSLESGMKDLSVQPGSEKSSTISSTLDKSAENTSMPPSVSGFTATAETRTTTPTFYDLSSIKFERVAHSSAYASTPESGVEPHLLGGREQLIDGRTINLHKELLRGIAIGIPIVAPDAPSKEYQRTGGRSPTSTPTVNLVTKFSTTGSPAEIPKFFKSAMAAASPEAMSGDNLNHIEGKAIVVAMLSNGFQGNNTNVVKEIINDISIDLNDPLTYNVIVAVLLGSLDTAGARQKRIGAANKKFQNPSEDLKSFFVEMLALLAAITEMSQFQQAQLVLDQMFPGNTQAQLKNSLMQMGEDAFNKANLDHNKLVTLVKQTWLHQAENNREADAPKSWATQDALTKYCEIHPDFKPPKKPALVAMPSKAEPTPPKPKPQPGRCGKCGTNHWANHNCPSTPGPTNAQTQGASGVGKTTGPPNPSTAGQANPPPRGVGGGSNPPNNGAQPGTGKGRGTIPS